MSIAGAAELQALARHIAAPGLFCAVAPIGMATPALLPDELACVARAIPRRRHEFAVGRMVLRHALHLAGHKLPETQPIVARSDRQPDLPPGLRASLSHSRDYCIAVAASDPALCPGVDIERMATDRPDDLAQAIAPWRQRPPVADAELLAFSAKESLFKSQYPETGMMLDFTDAALALSGHRMRARLACGRFLSGAWGQAAGHFLVISWRTRQTDGPELLPED